MEAQTLPDPAVFAEAPWGAIRWRAFGAARDVPTMLSRQERKLYLWLGQHWATGTGAIVDLGCFVGGSTAYLAQGAARARHAAPIHAFDRFRASEEVKELLLYPSGIDRFDGDDIEPLARSLLAPWDPQIVLHPGEIEEQSWDGSPIEILAIDAAKTAASADRMAEMFFPHLIPGRSIVVQQDFLHWKVPWIPAQMERMSEAFRPVAFCPRDTMAYLCVAPVTPAVLKAGRVSGLRDRALQEGLLAARERLAPFGLEDRLESMCRGLALNPHKRRAKDFTFRP